MKYRYLFKNSFWFMASSFGTSLISFFLTPIYTNVLKKGEMGIIDLLEFSALLFFFIISLDFSDSVARYTLDDSLDKPMILKIGINFLFKSGSIVAGIIVILAVLNIFDWNLLYYFFLFIQYIFLSCNLLLTQYLKGIEKVKIIAVASILSIAVRLIFVYLFLVYVKWGIAGYFVASFAGSFISILLYVCNITGFSNIFKIHVNKKIEKEMLIYSIPLAINAIGWWVAQGVDKYFVSYHFGYDLNGIYSVSYKIPSIISIMCNVFTSAFSISAVKELKDSHNQDFYKNTYTLFLSLLTVVCSFLIISNVFVTDFLFAEEYFDAWRYSSLLMVSSVFSGLGSYLGGLCDAFKKNKILAVSTVVSAVINIVLNVILIPRYAAVGAAVATIISMFFIYIIRFCYVEHFVKIHRYLMLEILTFLLLLIQLISDQIGNHNYSIQCVLLVSIVLLQIPNCLIILRSGRKI